MKLLLTCAGFVGTCRQNTFQSVSPASKAFQGCSARRGLVRFAEAFIITLLLSIFSKNGHALELQLPIDCAAMEGGCFIQNYPDNAPGDPYRDYQCRHLSYPGHKGTDFRVPDQSYLQQGIAVFASADGVVTATRDGMKDGEDINAHRDRLTKQGCGNAVKLQHDDGWETLYCHMRQGSVAVKKGQKVKTGDKLGEVGQSGLAAFPHVHLAVMHEGTSFDPFTGAPVEQKGIACGKNYGKTTLWAKDTLPPYLPSRVLGVGFGESPEKVKIYQKAGGAPSQLSANAQAIIFWVNMAGTEKNDQLTLTLTAPDGSRLAEHQGTIPQKATYYHFIGKRRPEDGWIAGAYTGEVTLERRGKTTLKQSATATVQ
jgi:hypothetical protein